MSEKLERRLATNEDVYREVNEGIVRGQWPGETHSRVGFRCECAHLGCNMLVELTVGDYERVRANPRRFLMVPGHQIPAVERVVLDAGEYIVVEKAGDAGREAQARAD
jgi:hypothetical protein